MIIEDQRSNLGSSSRAQWNSVVPRFIDLLCDHYLPHRREMVLFFTTQVPKERTLADPVWWSLGCLPRSSGPNISPVLRPRRGKPFDNTERKCSPERISKTSLLCVDFPAGPPAILPRWKTNISAWCAPKKSRLMVVAQQQQVLLWSDFWKSLGVCARFYDAKFKNFKSKND